MGEKVGILEKENFLGSQLFIRFNFVNGQFLPKTSLKLRFVLFKAEKVVTQWGLETPAMSGTFSGFKRTNLNFRLLLDGNGP